VVTLEFSGVLTSITDQYGFLNGQFAPGSAVSGTITYDTAVPEDSTTIGDPTVGIYSAVTSLQASVNGISFAGSPGSLPGYVQVWDDRIVGPSTVDAVTFSSPLDYSPPIAGMGAGTVVGAVNVNLFDFTHTASQEGKTMPTTVDLSKYGSTTFEALQVNVDTNESFHLDGVITSLTPVPEPSALALFFIGVLILAVQIGPRRRL